MSAFDPKRRIFLVLESAGPLELGFTFHDPGIGGLLPLERLRLAVRDSAPFLDDDLGDERLGTVFASPSYYRTHPLSYPVGWRSVGLASRSYFQ